MSNEVMTRNSEWMNHIVNHLNRMVDNFERAVKNYRPMLGGERFMTDKELSKEEFHQLTALIKGAVRPSARKMTPDEAKLWAEVSRVNTRLKQEMVAASFTVRALPGDLQEDAINILSKTVSEMLGDLTRLMAETGEP